MAWNIRPFVFPPSLLQQCTGSSSLADWLCVLPTSCLHLAVSAAVDPQTSAFSFARQLGMKDDVFNESLPAIASALQQLPVALHTITASGIHDGRALARAITTLKNLRCLELTQCLQPAVPETLTALTKLNIDCSNTLFECDISKFTTLKVCPSKAFRSMHTKYYQAVVLLGAQLNYHQPPVSIYDLSCTLIPKCTLLRAQIYSICCSSSRLSLLSMRSGNDASTVSENM